MHHLRTAFSQVASLQPLTHSLDARSPSTRGSPPVPAAMGKERNGPQASRLPCEPCFFSSSGGGLDEVQTDTTVPCSRPGHEAMCVFRPQLRDYLNIHLPAFRLLPRWGRRQFVIFGRGSLPQKEIMRRNAQGIDGRHFYGAAVGEEYVFRGCPACFLILKGVVISSHETNRFS